MQLIYAFIAKNRISHDMTRVLSGLACIEHQHEETDLGDNRIQICHLGRYIVGYRVGNFVLRQGVSGAVKHDFQTHIR